MPFNPFEEDDDGLDVTILKSMAKQLDYRLEGGRNTIDIFRGNLLCVV